MAVAALILYVVWLVLAFGVRTIVALRRTGDSGWRGISGTPRSLDWWAGVLFIVALVMGVAAPVAALAGLDPLLDSTPLGIVGVAVAFLGIALTLVTQLSMGDEWRIGVDHTEHTGLVTSGPFRLVRNPIFTAMAITAIGLTFIVPNVVALVGLAVLIAAVEMQVRAVEEPHLQREHGAAYRDYAAEVGRFIPGVGH